MIRVAFTVISGRDWTGTGISNYFTNLVQVLSEHSRGRVQPVMFAGTDAIAANVDPFANIPGVEIVRAAEYNEALRGRRLREALLIGCDRAAERCLRKHRIDVLFESAQFHGWRFPFPTIGWLPDFQHRHLQELFTFGAYWKRDLGFRAQVISGRHIMLSSEDSRHDCERFFPQSIGRTSVVRFAVRPPDTGDYGSARAIADSYKLPAHFFYLPNQFWTHKNHRVVIEALHILKQQGKGLVVAASGKPDDYRHPDHYKTLVALVQSHGLADNFRFIGMVPRQHVFALLRSCMALINPSLSEGWSTTVEEAKAFGVPMLLSGLPVHMEQAGDSARFFDPHASDQLASLMAEHRNLSASARQEMERLALAECPNRAKQFAGDFSNTVERAAARFPSPRVGARESEVKIGSLNVEGNADR